MEYEDKHSLLDEIHDNSTFVIKTTTTLLCMKLLYTAILYAKI